MILNVRGWYGSGKSTLVRRLLDEYGGREVEQLEGGSLRVYRAAGDLYVPGVYGKWGTGRGDSLNGDRGFEVADRYSELGFLVFENVNSSTRATWNEYLLQKQAVVVALDTPFDECIRRIYRRREETGRNVGKPLQLATQPDSHALVRRYLLEYHAAGGRAYWLDHREDFAYRQVVHLLLQEGWTPNV